MRSVKRCVPVWCCMVCHCGVGHQKSDRVGCILRQHTGLINTLLRAHQVILALVCVESADHGKVFKYRTRFFQRFTVSHLRCVKAQGHPVMGTARSGVAGRTVSVVLAPKPHAGLVSDHPSPQSPPRTASLPTPSFRASDEPVSSSGPDCSHRTPQLLVRLDLFAVLLSYSPVIWC